MLLEYLLLLWMAVVFVISVFIFSLNFSNFLSAFVIFFVFMFLLSFNLFFLSVLHQFKTILF